MSQPGIAAEKEKYFKLAAQPVTFTHPVKITRARKSYFTEYSRPIAGKPQ
jgi:hypothetical protein